MSQQPQGVLIAIDSENVRCGAQLYQRDVRPAELCRAMQDVSRVFGEMVGGKAFGGWSLRPGDGREFAEHDIVPYHAPRTSAGKDRSDPAILLEVYEWIRNREDYGTVILGSGDADYQALVDRASFHGRRIVLCAFSQSVSRDMLARPRYSRLRPSWVSSWRNMATSTWTSPRFLRRATPESTMSWNGSFGRCTSWKAG